MDFEEKLFGKESVECKKKFEEELLKIEERYIGFFRERKSTYKNDEHDRLHNHWMMYDDGYKIKFAFNKDSDIPNYIQEECKKAFNKIYS